MRNYLIGILLSLLTTLPLAAKWQLGVRRVACVVLVVAVMASGMIALVPARFIPFRWISALVWFLTISATFSLLAYRFYRDPERIPPSDEFAIVSPADGVVLYIRTSSEGMLPVSTKHGRDQPLVELTKTPLRGRDAVVIGIGMSFTDVHVNRAPISGKVSLHCHFPGRFGSLRHPEMVFENERATTIIEQKDFQVAVVQIASRLVRKIVAFISAGDSVALGQRIGVIRFGSQVDLVLPARPELKLTVKENERVRAGESIVAVLKPSGTPRDAVRSAGLVGNAQP